MAAQRPRRVDRCYVPDFRLGSNLGVGSPGTELEFAL